MPQMPRRVESLYKTHGNDTDFLSIHPLPNSVVVKATQFKSRIRSETAPMNKEGRKLDIIGRRQYSYSTFVPRVANYLAAMGAYQRHLWNQALPLFHDLPEDGRLKGTTLHKEAVSLSKQERIAVHHVVDTSSGQVATAIAL